MNFLLQFPCLLDLCIVVKFSIYYVEATELLRFRLMDRLEGYESRFLVRMELSLSERLVAVEFHLYVLFLGRMRSFMRVLLILEFVRQLVGFLKRFWKEQGIDRWRLICLEKNFLFRTNSIFQDLFFRYLRSYFGFHLRCFMIFRNLLCYIKVNLNYSNFGHRMFAIIENDVFAL